MVPVILLGHIVEKCRRTVSDRFLCQRYEICKLKSLR